MHKEYRMLTNRELRECDRFTKAVMAVKRSPEGAFDELPKSLAKRLKKVFPLRDFKKGGAFDESQSSKVLGDLQTHFGDAMNPGDCEKANSLLASLMDALANKRDDDDEGGEDDLDVDMSDREKGEMEPRGGKLKARGASDRRQAHDSRPLRASEADRSAFHARFPDVAKIKVL